MIGHPEESFSAEMLLRTQPKVGYGLLRAWLFGVTPLDPTSLVAAALVLALAALFASWLPARRATKVDPMVALRHE